MNKTKTKTKPTAQDWIDFSRLLRSTYTPPAPTPLPICHICGNQRQCEKFHMADVCSGIGSDSYSSGDFTICGECAPLLKQHNYHTETVENFFVRTRAVFCKE